MQKKDNNRVAADPGPYHIGHDRKEQIRCQTMGKPPQILASGAVWNG